MSVRKIDIYCPKCNHKNRVKVYDEISNELINNLISRDIFKFVCKNCNNATMLEYPLTVISDNYQIFFTPTKSDDIDNYEKEINRVCDTYDDLKEKVLILEDKLNDIIIEFIKLFYIDKLGREVVLRYDGTIDNNIYLKIMNEEESILCTMDFYNNLLKKAKFKKIKKACVIDRDTCLKYMKLR